MITVSIIGASGYAGGDLLRILSRHPHVTLQQVTSERYAGKPVDLVHPNLRGVTSLQFSSIDQLEACDLLIISLPNGKSMEKIESLTALADKIIDLGSDFRISPDDWHQWYKTPHLAEQFTNQFVYGVPELYRDQIAQAKCVAGPGCEAITSILTLWPAVKHQLIDLQSIIIDAKMGSSQAGSKPGISTHHAERSGVVRSYKPTGHRHTPEVTRSLTINQQVPQILISATAIEMVRGLLVTIHAQRKSDITNKHIWQAYREAYAQEPFMRIIKQTRGLYRYPEPKILQGTNFCEVGFEIDDYSQRLVLIGAIDNLVKGTAGNAIQCLNLMYDFPETTGLEFPGLHPI